MDGVDGRDLVLEIGDEGEKSLLRQRIQLFGRHPAGFFQPPVQFRLVIVVRHAGSPLPCIVYDGA